MSEGRQFIVEIVNAQGGVVGKVGTSGLRVVASRVTGTTAGAASSIITYGGNGQTGTVGTAITVPPSVQVIDSHGVGVAGSTVTWLSGGGSGGTSTGNTSTTNFNGVATVGSWTMGNTASGSSYSLLAYSGNLTNSPIGFVVTSVASGSPFSLAISGGTSQTSTPLGQFPSRCSVLVTDQFTNILSNATVTLTTEDPFGTFNASTITTNTSGVAGFNYFVGTSAQTFSVFANLSGSTVSVVFNSTTTSGLANTVNITGGDNQTGTSGSTLPNLITGSVDDGFGNPVTSGATVQFVIVAGSGNISRATQTPVASAWSVEWKMGATAGINKLEISLQNVSGSTVTASASGTNPLADTILIESGNNQSGTAAGALALPLAVATTGSGASASGQVVNFAITVDPSNGSASLSTTATASSATGVARTVLTLGPIVGTYTVVASAGTLVGSPLQFTATATANSATSLILTTQPLVNTQAGVAWSQQPVVVSTDSWGNLVSTNTRVEAVLFNTPTPNGNLGSGTSTAVIASGATATFSGLSYNGSGVYQTCYRCNSLSTATANQQNGAPPFASQLGFTTQPSTVIQGTSFNPSVVVAVQDSNGAVVTTATNLVTIAISGAGALNGTLSQNAVGGYATFTAMGPTAGTAVGNYTLSATATGLTGATSASFPVTTSGVGGAAFPNEPNWPLMFDHTGKTAPTGTTDSAPDTGTGKWKYGSGAGFNSVLDSAFTTTAPVSSNSINRYQYTSTQAIGSGSINVQCWDTSGTGVSNSQVSHIYLGVWFNAFGSGGTDFEITPLQFKWLGFLAYGTSPTAGARNESYWMLSSAQTRTSSFSMDYRQQAGSLGLSPAGTISGKANVNVGQWYLFEFIGILNSAAGVADGAVHQYITPQGGATTEFSVHSNVVFMTTNATNKFNLWKFNNTYGGSGSTAKTRTDYVLFDNLRIRGY